MFLKLRAPLKFFVLLLFLFSFFFQPYLAKSSKASTPGLADSAWPMFQHDPQHTGRSEYRGPESPVVKWSRSWNSTSNHSSPIIGSDGTIYLEYGVGTNMSLKAVNPDGTDKWTFVPPEYPTGCPGCSLEGTPALGTDGTIYVGFTGGGFYAINPNGTVKWKYIVDGPIVASAAIGTDGTIYVGSMDKNIYAFNPDGTLKWKSYLGFWVYQSGIAIAQDGTLYVGTTDYPTNSGVLWALNPDGSIKWNITLTFYPGIKSSPVIGNDGTIYVGAGPRVYAVNPDSTLKWNDYVGGNDQDTVVTMALGLDGTLYVSSVGGLYAYNPNGQILWVREGGYARDPLGSSPIIDSAGVIYSSSVNFLEAFGSDGTFKWRIPQSYSKSSPALAADGTLYFADYWTLRAISSPPNHPPTLSANLLSVVSNEGQVALNTGTVNDLDGNTVALAASIGTITNNGDGTWSWSYPSTDGPLQSQTVTITGDDGKGGTTSVTFDLVVNNVAPNVGTIIAPTDPVIVNTVIDTTANFTDPGIFDTPNAVWYWDDGSTSAGIVSETTGLVSGSHVYTAAGVYSPTLIVTDKDGASGQSTFQYVVVFDSTAGFVTGAGMIDSPAGAYPQDVSISGRASFGFSVKYLPGDMAPNGGSQFKFRLADISFASTNYQWLVVSGSKATFRGVGTNNGGGAYTFVVTTIDGSPDKYRIKIIDNATNSVFYDNEMGSPETSDPTTSLEAGSVVIH